jgi:hypothetical protein
MATRSTPQDLAQQPPDLSSSAQQVEISLLSNAAGTPTSAYESFSETRAITVKMLKDVTVYKMKLVGSSPAVSNNFVLGGRIYDGNHTLLATADSSGAFAGIGPFSIEVTLTNPLLLKTNQIYHVSFYCSSGTGALFQASNIPYKEPSGRFSIEGARSGAPDAFPASTNLFLPQIRLSVR